MLTRVEIKEKPADALLNPRDSGEGALDTILEFILAARGHCPETVVPLVPPDPRVRTGCRWVWPEMEQFVVPVCGRHARLRRLIFARARAVEDEENSVEFAVRRIHQMAKGAESGFSARTDSLILPCAENNETMFTDGRALEVLSDQLSCDVPWPPGELAPRLPRILSDDPFPLPAGRVAGGFRPRLLRCLQIFLTLFAMNRPETAGRGSSAAVGEVDVARVDFISADIDHRCSGIFRQPSKNLFRQLNGRYLVVFAMGLGWPAVDLMG